MEENIKFRMLIYFLLIISMLDLLKMNLYDKIEDKSLKLKNAIRENCYCSEGLQEEKYRENTIFK